MLKIRCVVEHITYQNAENGYSIMKVNVKGYKDLAVSYTHLKFWPFFVVGHFNFCYLNGYAEPQVSLFTYLLYATARSASHAIVYG